LKEINLQRQLLLLLLGLGCWAARRDDFFRKQSIRGYIVAKKKVDLVENSRLVSSLTAGLPDFSLNVTPKPEKCTKLTQNAPNGHKIFQVSKNIPNSHKICKHFLIQGLLKFTQIGTFGLKHKPSGNPV
jgi:hypothetical protein